jgi:hypothetical protein
MQTLESSDGKRSAGFTVSRNRPFRLSNRRMIGFEGSMISVWRERSRDQARLMVEGFKLEMEY